jgi:sodium-dependent dicarboxylate transporter 2/3/5
MINEDVLIDPGTGAATEELSAGEKIFETWRKRLGVVLTPISFFLTYFLCDGLTPEGRKLAAILVAIAIMWVSEVIPLAVSALLGAVLCVVLGVADAKTVLASFADPIVFVFIGGFMLAQAMMIHGLDRRIALGFLSIPWVGSSAGRTMAGLGLVTAVLSMWVSNSATTAMMLPIALGILGTMHQMRVAKGETRGTMDAKNWPFATGMMLMVAYGASLGGIGTPVGSPPNLIGIGLIRSATGVDISFFQWMLLTIPIFCIMGPALFALLYFLHPTTPQTSVTQSGTQHEPNAPQDADLLSYIRRERSELGSWTWGQRNTLIAFSVAIVLWVAPGILQLPWFKGNLLGEWMNTHLPESIVALIAAILLFMLPINVKKGEFTLSWPQAVKIDWGTILLFGGGLALGSLMFKTGVAEAMGQALAAQLGVSSLWALTALSIAMAIVLSEAASNTASATMIIPVVIAIAQGAGVSPLPPALGACLGASFGFMLPVSTPPNAIVYGSGLVPIPKMVRAGILFDLLGFALIWVGLRVLCPLLGFV